MTQTHDLVRPGRWRRFTAALPMRTALTGVTAVWALGCLWSFNEQQRFAAAKGFALPWVLPLVIDGLAAAMAGVAYAASLDGRAALPARAATALAVAASATSNAAWAWERSGGDPGAVALAVGIPVAANLAFEVLLSELRRQVQRRRGLPAPVPVPAPRLIRLVLAPHSTLVTWRRLVLELTDPRTTVGPRPVAVNGYRPPEPGPAAAPVPTVALGEPTPAAPASSAAVPSAGAPDPTVPEPAVSARAAGARAAAPAPPGAWPTVESARGEPAARPRPAPERSIAARTVTEPTVAVRMVPEPAHDGRLRPADPADERVRRLADLIVDGEVLTGDSVGDLLGCSARTGRRLLRQAELAVANGSEWPAEAVDR